MRRRVPTRIELAIGDRLTRARLRFAAGATLVVGCLLLLFSFATSHNNRAASGLGLGSDWLAFYNAGTILNTRGPARLYDLNLQAELYHEQLPDEPDNASLPYANAPFLAVALRPLATLSYALSYGCWVFISIALYAAGFIAVWQSTGVLKRYGPVALLLALSFEPFVIECLHGGQISALAFFAICCAIRLSITSRPFRAGLMLALCTYKPTLLPWILPMLLVMRQWRTLGGFAIGATALGLMSLVTVGPQVCFDYAHMLLGYAGRTSSAGAGGFQLCKFMDLNSFFKLLGTPTPLVWATLLSAATALALHVWRIRPRNAEDATKHLRLAWAVAVTCTVVLNLYVGVYDSILIVPAIALTASALLRRTNDTPRQLPLRFRCLLVAVWALPWVSGLIARDLSFQPYTIALLTLAGYQLQLWTTRVRTATTARASATDRRQTAACGVANPTIHVAPSATPRLD